MDSEYALGRMVKKGASVKIEVCVPVVAEPVTGLPYGTQPPTNRSGIVDGEHGHLGAPMQMQCKAKKHISVNKTRNLEFESSSLTPQQSRQKL